MEVAQSGGATAKPLVPKVAAPALVGLVDGAFDAQELDARPSGKFSAAALGSEGQLLQLAFAALSVEPISSTTQQTSIVIVGLIVSMVCTALLMLRFIPALPTWGSAALETKTGISGQKNFPAPDEDYPKEAHRLGAVSHCDSSSGSDRTASGSSDRVWKHARWDRRGLSDGFTDAQMNDIMQTGKELTTAQLQYILRSVLAEHQKKEPSTMAATLSDGQLDSIAKRLTTRMQEQSIQDDENEHERSRSPERSARKPSTGQVLWQRPASREAVDNTLTPFCVASTPSPTNASRQPSSAYGISNDQLESFEYLVSKGIERAFTREGTRTETSDADFDLSEAQLEQLIREMTAHEAQSSDNRRAHASAPVSQQRLATNRASSTKLLSPRATSQRSTAPKLRLLDDGGSPQIL